MAQEINGLSDAIKNNDLDLVKISIKTGINPNQPLPGYNYNALFLAIEFQRNEIIDYLLKNGFTIDYEEPLCNYQTPLTFAIHKNQINLVKFLITKGASINQVHTDGDTPLTLAIRLNKLTIVECLLQYGADVNLVGWKEKTPLIWAITKKNLSAVQTLISYGADIKKNGKEILELAKNMSLEIYDYLISYLTDPGASKILAKKGVEIEQCCSNKICFNKIALDGLTPLLRAIECRNINEIKELIKTGTDCCQCNNDGITPLILAVRNGDLEIIQLLLDNGAEDTIHTALLEAISIGDSQIVNILLENGALVNIVYKNGNTPLTKAIQKENMEIIKQLVANGANVNMPDGEGNYPLSLAVDTNNLDLVKYLIDNVIPSESFFESCPFMLKFIEEGNFEMVKILVDLGVKLDTIYECGNTVLSKAVKCDKFDIVKYLIERGADINQKNLSGKVPLAIAANNKNLRIVKFLIKSKANLELAKNEIEKYRKKNEDFQIFMEVLSGKYTMWDSNMALALLNRTSEESVD